MAAGVPVEKHALFVPVLEDVAEALQEGLADNFGVVSASVVDCPDLSAAPFSLAMPGVCGNATAVDVSGPPRLLPLVDRTKLYDVRKLGELLDMRNSTFIGAGAGPHPLIGVNSELMCNVKLGSNAVNNSYIAKLNDDGKEAALHKLNSTSFALMANLFVSDGQRGRVLEVKASKRTGEDNFMSCIRKALTKKFDEKPVALGGTFLVQKGKAKLHVMPDFSKTPITSNEGVNEWLRFFEYDSPLTAVGYLVSHDPGWDLRIEHFHCFSDHGVGGHYHYDVTPDDVEYCGYFNLAETLYRVDRPANTHTIGRD